MENQCDFCTYYPDSFHVRFSIYWICGLFFLQVFFLIRHFVTYARLSKRCTLGGAFSYLKGVFLSKVEQSVASLISKRTGRRILYYMFLCVFPFFCLALYVLTPALPSPWSPIVQSLMSSAHFFVTMFVLGIIGTKYSLYKIYIDKFIPKKEAKILLVYQVAKAWYGALALELVQIIPAIINEFTCVNGSNPEIINYFFRNGFILMLVVDRLKFFKLEKDILNNYAESKRIENIQESYKQIVEQSLDIKKEMIMEIKKSTSNEQALLGEVTEFIKTSSQRLEKMMTSRLQIEEKGKRNPLIRNQGDNVIYCKLILGYYFIISIFNIMAGGYAYFNTYFENEYHHNCTFFYLNKANLLIGFTVVAWVLTRLTCNRNTVGKFNEQDLINFHDSGRSTSLMKSNEFQSFRDSSF